jgi:hypothetical protein
MRRNAAWLVIALVTLAACGEKTSGRITMPDAGTPGPRVELHYLGNGGWLIRRGDDVVATAPFASNPVGPAVYLPFEPDTARIDAVVPVLPELKVMLIGHSHYDHAMDLPHILVNRAPNATLYGSKTVKHLLGATVGHDRVVDVTDASKGMRAAEGPTPGTWVKPAGTSVRFMPLASSHAPHLLGFIKIVRWGTLTADVPKGKLPRIPARWPEGETLAYLIDFLRPDGSVEFRVYYQDSAAKAGTGAVPTLAPPDDAPVDVAILCVAGFSQVRENPERILANAKPRYVVGGHWEDFFFRPSTTDEHYVAPNTSLDDFVRRAHEASKAPVSVPRPGGTLFIPIQPR